jgi:predicted dehydrogenase
VETTFAGMLYYGTDLAANVDSSFELPYRAVAEVVGEQGILTLDSPFHISRPNSVLTLRRGDEAEVIEVDNPDAYWLEIEDIHDAILTGEAPLITPAETRGHIETILQLYAAAQAS